MEALCDRVADAVREAVDDAVGRSGMGKVVGMGADGTPTKRIDEVAEDAALDVLESHGDLRVVSEETGEVVYGEPELTVVMDPLDGTYNASHGIPLYALSIAIAEGGSVRDVTYAYVEELNTGGTYTARRGEGAEYEGRAIEVGGASDPGEMTVTGVYNIESFDPAVFDRVRLFGCSSFELCLVAADSLDGFVDMRGYLRVLDFAAAKLVVEEAGGVVTDGGGGEIDEEISARRRSSVVAGSPATHEAIMEVVS